MTYRILAVGKLKSSEKELFDRYAKRLGKSLNLLELPESQENKLAGKRDPSFATVCLDEHGQNLSTASLHDWCRGQDYRVEFVIGGADGLSPDIRNQAKLELAFGALTWPHQLARVLLVEQIYRIETIRQRHPYHRV